MAGQQLLASERPVPRGLSTVPLREGDCSRPSRSLTCQENDDDDDEWTAGSMSKKSSSPFSAELSRLGLDLALDKASCQEVEQQLLETNAFTSFCLILKALPPNLSCRYRVDTRGQSLL